MLIHNTTTTKQQQQLEESSNNNNNTIQMNIQSDDFECLPCFSFTNSYARLTRVCVCLCANVQKTRKRERKSKKKQSARKFLALICKKYIRH